MITLLAAFMSAGIGLASGWALRGAVDNPKPIGVDDWNPDPQPAPAPGSIHAKQDDVRRRTGRLHVDGL